MLPSPKTVVEEYLDTHHVRLIPTELEVEEGMEKLRYNYKETLRLSNI
jgi:hypothetical protein